jgi:hypothetical protein
MGNKNLNSRQNGGLQSKLTEVQQHPKEAAVTVAQYISFVRKYFAFTGDNRDTILGDCGVMLKEKI